MNQYPPTNQQGVILPSDRGFSAWTYDPTISGANGSPASGQFVASLFRWPGGLMTNMFAACSVNAFNATAGQNLAGIYSESGLLIAQTGDLSALLMAGCTNAYPLTAPTYLAPGRYYAGMVQNATTLTAALGRISANITIDIIGTNGLNSLRGGSISGLTALPANLSALTNGGLIYWFGFS